MNEAIALYSLVKELKRRRMFVSLLVTNAETRITFWTGIKLNRPNQKTDRPHLVTASPDVAWGYIRAIRENERSELDWVGRRYGRTPASKPE